MTNGSAVVEASTNLGADAASARAARRFVARTLDAWACGDVADVAELLTNELVTNVVLHARTSLEVRMRHDANRLRVEVCDLSPSVPSRRTNPLDAHTGRGLQLLDALAERWGVERRGGGKAVWFELAT